MNLTRSRMERELRAALTSGRVAIRAGKLQNAAALVMLGGPPPHPVVIDRHQGGALECAVHELLHVVYRDQLATWGDLEESIVAALEDELVRHINRSKERMAWWRKRLDAALEGA